MNEITVEKRISLFAPMSREEIATALKIHKDTLRKMLHKIGITHADQLTQKELNRLEEHYFG